MELLTERYFDDIAGIISCYDRVIIQGTLPGFSFSGGMTGFLRANHIRIFDYPQFAYGLRQEIRRNAEEIAETNGLEIEFIRKKKFNKEKRVQAILRERGYRPGLVHIFSAKESCTSYKLWRDKQSGKTYLRTDSGKCLHYYFWIFAKSYG